jgi:hypothetical protein
MGEEEILQASILSFAQKQLLQNDMASAAEQLINEEFHPEKPLEYAKQKAFLDAQIATYQYILDRSNAAEETLKRLNESSANLPRGSRN